MMRFVFCCFLAFFGAAVVAFAPPAASRAVTSVPAASNRAVTSVRLQADSSSSSTELGVYGGLGTAASLVVLWSEFTLKTTGCGLPAGPLGLLGAAEGISYLAIVGIIGASVTTKVRTKAGLPAGPLGLLGAAEGLAYVAAAVGVVVLAFQIADYGYVPNAVPVQGGVCS